MSTPIFKHHLQEITKAELNEAVKSYRDGLPENETQSCYVSLHEINQLVNRSDKSICGFRIYFYREDKDRPYNDSPEQKILEVGNKTQLSIIMVPVKNYRRLGKKKVGFEVTEMFDPKNTGKCWTLTPGGEHTGLCPTNCPK